MVAHTFNYNIWEAEVARYLWVQGQCGLYSEFQSSQGYTVELCFKNKQKFIESKYFMLIRYADYVPW